MLQFRIKVVKLALAAALIACSEEQMSLKCADGTTQLQSPTWQAHGHTTVPAPPAEQVGHDMFFLVAGACISCVIFLCLWCNLP